MELFITILLTILCMAAIYVCFKGIKDVAKQESFTNVLVLPLSTFIPCKWDHMEDDFLKGMGTEQDRKALKRVIQDLFTCFDHKYHHFLIDMNVNYHLLNPVRESKDLKDLAEIENHFLSYLRTLFIKGDFHELTDVEMNFGTAESFQLTFPIEVDFDQLNDNHFVRFKKTSGHDTSLSDNIWIFTRGNGETKMTDRFFWARIDLMMKCFAKYVYSWFIKIEEKKVEIPEKGIVLKRQPLVAPSSIFDLFRQTTVVEPTFKEVFIVFRRKDEAVNKNEIFIRQFEDIPMADIELVYPYVNLGYRTIDIIWLTGTALLALFGFFCEVTGYSPFGGSDGVEEAVQAGWTFSWTTMISLASFGFCLFQFYQSYTNFDDEYKNLMTNLISNKTTSGRAAMLQLSERAKYQDLKESCACYYFLLKHGRMAREKLKEMIDTYTNTRQKLWVTNFDIDDSLDKVIEIGVCEFKKETETYESIPLKQALERIKLYYNKLCDSDLKPFHWEDEKNDMKEQFIERKSHL